MSNLDVKITADVVDLQTKMSVAKAEVQAYSAELRKLAQQSAEGILDPAGQAKLQQAAEDFIKAQQEARNLSNEMKELRETSGGLGEAFEGIAGKLSGLLAFSGITVAVEGIRQIGEALEGVGNQGKELETVSEVLGVSTDQLQAMQHAAEEAGVSSDTLVRAGEKLISMLNEARNGSGAAVEKLEALGVSAQQALSPATGLNDILEVIHDRLINTSTAQAEMNNLIQLLGPRAALASEALKKYDGSAEAVKEVMQAINGLTPEQAKQAAELSAKWEEFGTKFSNTMHKAVLGTVGFLSATAHLIAQSGEAIAAAEGGGNIPGETSKSSEADQAVEEQREIVAAAKQSADSQKALQQQALQQALAVIKENVAAFKSGSAERVAQLKVELEVARQAYGADQIDKVREVQSQLTQAEREYHDKSGQMWRQDFDLQWKLVQDEGKIQLDNIAQSLAADEQYLSERKRIIETIDSLDQTSAELNKHLTEERKQATQELSKVNKEVTTQMQQDWKFLNDSLKNGLDQALKGMLTGTETFGQAMRNLFTSILDGIISKLSSWAAEWITNLVIAKTMNQSTAASQISANAGVAATAAMASVAAIPIVGWAMAPEVGAATAAEALGFESMVAAAQGWDIPRGSMPPPAQLHPGEMVLPSALAEGFRNIIGNQQGAAPSRAPSIVNIHGGKSATFTGDQLASMLKELGHRFAFR